MIRWIRAVLFMALSSFGLTVQADALLDSCVACHGEDGAGGDGATPIIGGVSDYYLEYAMQTYRDGGRSCPDVAVPGGEEQHKCSMCDVAEPLSDEEIARVSAHYAAQDFRPAEQETDPKLVAAGQKLHQSQCARCHADNGGDPADDAGILAGQRIEYLNFAFQDFISGRRPTLKPMQQKMQALSPEQAEALVHFYASQR